MEYKEALWDFIRRANSPAACQKVLDELNVCEFAGKMEPLTLALERICNKVTKRKNTIVEEVANDVEATIRRNWTTKESPQPCSTSTS